MQHLELSPISILSLFSTTKEQRQSFVQQVLDSVESGNTSPLTLHLQLKCTEEIIKAITGNEGFKSSLLKEAIKYDKQEFHNSKITVKEAGVKWDYSECGDPELVRLQTEYDIAKKALEERQTFLKNAPKSGIDVLVDGGEIVRVFAPVKTSSTTVTVTLK